MGDSVTAKEVRGYAGDPLLFLSDLVIPGGDGPERFDGIWANFQVEAFRAISPCLQSVAKGARPPLRGAWIERTKGASKDSDVGCCLLWLLLFSKVPLLIELGADHMDQAKETWLAMRDVVRLNSWMGSYFEMYAKKFIGTRTGSVCEFLTSTKAGAHGSRPNVTVCNELSHITEREFAETMLDNAGKVPGNFTIIATNAGYLNTWQYDWRETYRGQAGAGRWYFQKMAEPSPWLTEADIEEARGRNSTSRFNRLWCGVWSADKGDALDQTDVEAAFVRSDPMSPAEVAAGGWVCVAGIDAGVRQDHAALVVLATRFNGSVVRLARCQSWAPGPDGRIDLALLRAAIKKAYEDYGLLQANFDPHQMEYMAQELAREGVPMVAIDFVGKNCNQMAKDLLTVFRGREIELYEAPRLRDDLYQLRIVEKSFGYKLEAPSGEGGHADRAIALAVALPTALACMGSNPPPEVEEAEHVIEI